MGEFPSILPAAPEIFLAGSALVLLLLGVFRGDGSTRLVSHLAAAALLVAAILVLSHTGPRELAFGGLFVVDGFGVFMKTLVLIGAAAVVMVGQGYAERQRMDRFEFPVLIVLSSLGMMMMISANDLIALYMGLETQSLALYVLAAFRRDNQRSSEAGLKYFVLGALSSGLLLFGASAWCSWPPVWRSRWRRCLSICGRRMSTRGRRPL
jgi:NADH-quinone oxidoreductase subunit N